MKPLLLWLAIGFAMRAPINAQSIGAGRCVHAITCGTPAWDSLPVDPNSSAYITMIGSATHSHADFGTGLTTGIPFRISLLMQLRESTGLPR